MKKHIILILFGFLLSTVLVGASESGTLLVLNKTDNTVSLIDLASRKTVATVPTGVGPHEVAVSADGHIGVVADYGAQTPGNTLTVIDIPGKKVVKTIDLGKYRRPHGIVWVNDKLVSVTAEANQALLLVNVEEGEVRTSIETGQKVSHMVAVTSKTLRAFVANIGSGSVTVIDLKKSQPIANIETGAGAEGIDISPDEKEVWVSNRAANTVTVIDADTLKVLATLESKDFPIRVKFTPDGKHVLVSNARSGDVAIFDAGTRKEINRVPMEVKAAEASETSKRLFGTQFGQSPVPVGILVAPGLNHAFVANTNADIVTMIDLKNWKIVDRLTAGREPDGLGYSPLTVK